MYIRLDRDDVPQVDTVLCGDSRLVLRDYTDASFDALVCDPPGGLNFMNLAFDRDRGGRERWIAWLMEIMQETLRTLSPGAYGLVWALPRTSHWTMTALEDAGFIIRDVLTHHFSEGLPKGLNVSKAIDKTLGAERIILGPHRYATRRVNPTQRRTFAQDAREQHQHVETANATIEAQQWDGWNTTLKPATEYWILVQKPLTEKSIVRQVLTTGTGALHINACRIEAQDGQLAEKYASVRNAPARANHVYGEDKRERSECPTTPHPLGRYPSNVIFSHAWDCTESVCSEDCPVTELDKQSGVRKSGGGIKGKRSKVNTYGTPSQDLTTCYTPDVGGASRYFTTLWSDEHPFIYQAKASQRDRTADGVVENDHPTVKSTTLMSWLVKLITPSGGTVLDCFCGSGSTLVAAVRGGFHYVGIDENSHYVSIAQARVDAELLQRSA